MPKEKKPSKAPISKDEQEAIRSLCDRDGVDKISALWEIDVETLGRASLGAAVTRGTRRGIAEGLWLEKNQADCPELRADPSVYYLKKREAK